MLTGQPLPLRPPFFGGTIPEPAAEAVVEAIAANATDAAADGEDSLKTKEAETQASTAPAAAAAGDKLAPLFAKQPGSARKRSLEKTTTTESGAEGKRPKANGKQGEDSLMMSLRRL